MYLRIKWYFRYLYHVSGYSPCWSPRSRRTSSPGGWRTWPPGWPGPFTWWGPPLSTFTPISVSVPVTLVALSFVIRRLITTSAWLLTISSASYTFIQLSFNDLTLILEFFLCISLSNIIANYTCLGSHLQLLNYRRLLRNLNFPGLCKNNKNLERGLPCCCCCWGGGCGCCPISGGGGCGKGAGAMFVIMGGGLSNPCPGLGWGGGWMEGGGCVGCNVSNYGTSLCMTTN